MALLITNFDYSKLFIWNNRFKTATYTNSTGSSVTLALGTVMGRIASTNKVVPCDSTATDGSQIPVGVLGAEYTVADSASQTVSFCYSGDVAKDLLTFHGSDALTTVLHLVDNASPVDTIVLGTMEDVLTRNGINPISTDEHTYQDNQ